MIATLVGLLALLVSGYTAVLQRQQVRAQVWPYLEHGLSGSTHTMVLLNKGVGPAIVRTLRIYVDGKPQRDWKRVLESLGLSFEHPPPYSTVSGIVIAAGERIEQVLFGNRENFNAYAAQADRLKMVICWCSTLDECWLRDEREQDPVRNFRTVAACPAPGPDDFIDNEVAEAAPPPREEQ